MARIPYEQIARTFLKAKRHSVKSKTIISRKRYAVQYLRKRLAHYYEAFLKN